MYPDVSPATVLLVPHTCRRDKTAVETDDGERLNPAGIKGTYLICRESQRVTAAASAEPDDVQQRLRVLQLRDETAAAARPQDPSRCVTSALLASLSSACFLHTRSHRCHDQSIHVSWSHAVNSNAYLSMGGSQLKCLPEHGWFLRSETLYRAGEERDWRAALQEAMATENAAAASHDSIGSAAEDINEAWVPS